MLKAKPTKKGFTLIELLVVIAIIGILATIAIVSLQQARKNARDAKRIADVKQMMTALELYFNDNQQYPPSSSLITSVASGSNVYMAILPEAPTPADGDCQTASNTYMYSEIGVDNSSYIISFCLGGKTGGLTAGPKCATPGGILNADCSGGNILYNDGGDGEGDFSGNFGTFIDSRDSQEYDWVKIGDQIWMAENLSYLPAVHNNSEFVTQGSNQLPGYGVYGYDGNDVTTAKLQSNYSTYGVLYNWFAVNQVSICPSGWSVPSNEEWTTLTDYLGGSFSAGGKMKQTGTTHWNSPNTGATNESGFTALPGGARRVEDGLFSGINVSARFWSSSLAEITPNKAIHLQLLWNTAELFNGEVDQSLGFSVRCLKN